MTHSGLNDTRCTCGLPEEDCGPCELHGAAAQEESGKPETVRLDKDLTQWLMAYGQASWTHDDDKAKLARDKVFAAVQMLAAPPPAARPGAPEPVAWRSRRQRKRPVVPDGSLWTPWTYHDMGYPDSTPRPWEVLVEVQPLYLGAPAATPEVTENMKEAERLLSEVANRHRLGLLPRMNFWRECASCAEILRAALEGGESESLSGKSA